MIRSFLWILLGAAAALQVDRWLEARKARFTPSALTGSFLDKVNDRLESKRGADLYR